MSSGLPKGRRAEYICLWRLWSYVVPTRYADRTLAQEVDRTQREKGYMTQRQPTEHGDGHHVMRAWGWKAGSGEERMKMCIFLKVHGMEVMECGARRDTLSHTWASDQSWKVQSICRSHEPLFKPPLSQTPGPSRLFLPSSQEPR